MAKYILNLVPNVDPHLILNCSQYDTGLRVFTLTLKNGCSTYLIPKDATVTVRGKKPDLNVFEYPVEFNGNIVTLDLKEQMTPLAGSVECELRIEQDSQLLGTANFILKVEESPINENTVISETELPLIEEAIQAAEKIENLKDNISATVTENEQGALIEITDLDGTTTAQIYNGQPGTPGQDGQDGFSPIANVVKDGDDTIITITDKTGTTTATIKTSGYDDTQIRQLIANTAAALETETGLREAGDAALQTQINNLEIPEKTSDLINDSGYITNAALEGYATEQKLTQEIADTKALIPNKTSDLTNDSNYVSDANYNHTDNNYTNNEKTKLAGIEAGAEANVQSDWNEADNTSDAYIANKPTIPTKTSDLTNDSGYVADANYNHTDNNYTSSEKSKLAGIEAGAEANVQSDWSETDNTSDAYIANKPTIPTKTSDLTNDGEGGTFKFKLASPGDASLAVVATNISFYNTNGDYVLVNKTSTPNVITLSDSTMSGTSIQIPTIDYINSLNANSTQY